MPSPEQKLWRAVLGQAYADAEIGTGSDADPCMDHNGASGSDHHDLAESPDIAHATITRVVDVTEADARIRGRRFLRAEGPEEAAELAEVCELADVPADRLIRWARRKYESQPPAPPRRKPGPRSKQELQADADSNRSTTECPSGASQDHHD